MPFLGWVVAALGSAVDGVMASHLNPKTPAVVWDQLLVKWQASTEAGYLDNPQKSRQCVQYVLGGVDAAGTNYSYHYSGDKGWAGFFVVVLRKELYFVVVAAFVLVVVVVLSQTVLLIVLIVVCPLLFVVVLSQYIRLLYVVVVVLSQYMLLLMCCVSICCC